MNIAINILLFVFSGLFSLTFFSQSHFYGFGETMVSRTTVLYVLGGIVLTLGGITRLLTPEIRAITGGN